MQQQLQQQLLLLLLPSSPLSFFLVVSISVNRYTYKNQRCQKAKMTAKWIRKLTFRALRLAKHQREKPK